MAETEFMPIRGGGDTELVGSKLKRGKGFLEPNFERGPKADATNVGFHLKAAISN